MFDKVWRDSNLYGSAKQANGLSKGFIQNFRLHPLSKSLEKNKNKAKSPVNS